MCGLFLTVKFSCLFTAVAVLAWQLLKVSIMLRCKTLRFKTLRFKTLRHTRYDATLYIENKFNTSWCVRSSARINWPVRGGCVCDHKLYIEKSVNTYLYITVA